MRIYGEVGFDVLYLIVAIAVGIRLLRSARGERLFVLLGAMALVLGVGDAFHLIPRVEALVTTGQVLNTPQIGLGKLVTSITMTVFYVLLYHAWQMRYGKAARWVTPALYALAAVRVFLCALPQNQWFVLNPPVAWGVWRNIPFALLGGIMVWLFFIKRNEYRPFRFMWLAVLLSFLFYIPVVLWADAAPALGALMIPKTLCYVWMLLMGLAARRQHD